ncbi:MAG: hypothetical protein ACLPX9_17460 [Rhodomicrobium sp.]
MLDIGAGDGKTSSFLLSNLLGNVNIGIIEPNSEYRNTYSDVAHSACSLTKFDVISETIDDVFGGASGEGVFETYNETQDICMSLHSIYFASNLEMFLRRVFRFLSNGGRIIISFADELDGFTGRVCSAFVEQVNGESGAYRSKFEHRHQVFGISQGKADFALAHTNLEGIFGTTGFEIEQIENQPSRFFGNNFGDIIASSFLTDLPYLATLSIRQKIEFVAEFISKSPADIDLCLELEGPRRGMLSVTQPQYFVCIRKGSH